MPHTVWNLGAQGAGRLQARQFVAGIEPGQEVVIGRAREPKRMIVLLDAWMEIIDITTVGGASAVEGHVAKVNLALGKDPLNNALLLPVGEILTITSDRSAGTNQSDLGFGPSVRELFRAQGTMWAAKEIAIDIALEGDLWTTIDVDVHLDWTVAGVDWWTWFIGWNQLEAPPDGSLTDGERAYA